MRKVTFLSIIISLIISTISHAQSSSEIGDFRGMTWGTLIKDARQDGLSNPIFNLQATAGEKISIFILPNDSHEIGSVQLTEIYYYFHDDAGFFKVVMSGPAKYNDQMDALVLNKLGRNYQTVMNTTNSHKLWQKGDVLVDYKQQMSEDFTLTLKSDAIDKYLEKQNQRIEDF